MLFATFSLRLSSDQGYPEPRIGQQYNLSRRRNLSQSVEYRIELHFTHLQSELHPPFEAARRVTSKNLHLWFSDRIMPKHESQDLSCSGNSGPLPEIDIEHQDQPLCGTLYLDRRDSSGTADTSSTDESSPLMNPLKTMPKRTTYRIWLNHARRQYEKNLNERPVVTKALTSACLTMVGDFVGQSIEQYRLEYDTSETIHFDLVRLVKFSFMGLCLQAPLTHYFYVVLDYYLPPTPLPWTPTTFLKMACDQLIYAPFFTFVVISYLGIFGGSSLLSIREQLDAEYWRTLVDNWKLWVPATLINMAYVPPAYRVLYCNVVFFVWSIYLSLFLNAPG